jgi:hypothetical protein
MVAVSRSRASETIAASTEEETLMQCFGGERITRWIAAAVALVLVATPAWARNDTSSNSYYRSSDGSMVYGPTREDNPNYGKITADCRDGTHSSSHHHSGTCSGHGGVASWR